MPACFYRNQETQSFIADSKKNVSFAISIINIFVMCFHRWKTCISDTSDGFGMAIGYAYVNKHFPKKTKQAVSMLVKLNF